MAFNVPEMPLAVDIYTGPWASRVLRLSTVGNLAPGRRTVDGPFGWDAGNAIGPLSVFLLLPAGTDIRDWSCGGHQTDFVDCPAGSGRWYGVLNVDDFGKGFPNEHRFAMIAKVFSFLNGTSYPALDWPTPIP